MNPNAAKEDDLETYIQSVNAKMPVNKRQTVKLGNEKYYLVITQLECIEGKIYQSTPQNLQRKDLKYSILCYSLARS